MNLGLILLALASIIPGIISAHSSYLARKQNTTLASFLLGLSAAHALTAFLQIYWAVTYNPSMMETLMTYELFIGAQTALIIGTIITLLPNKKLAWLLLAYLITIPVLWFSDISAINIFALVSLFVQLAFFTVTTLQPQQSIRKIGTYGLISTVLAIVTFLLGISESNLLLPGLGVSTLILSLVYAAIRSHIKHNHLTPKLARTNLVLGILRFIVLVPALTIFLLFVTISVHEFGHAFMANSLGCEYVQAIVYQPNSSAHATAQCSEPEHSFIIALAGPILPLILALLFVLVNKEFTTILALYLMGFGFIFFYGDLNQIEAANYIPMITTILGFIFLIYGVVKMSLFFLKETITH